MQLDCIHSLLAKLVALTHERDKTSLELALIKTLADFIDASQTIRAKSVVLYHIYDLQQQLLTALSATQPSTSNSLSDSLKISIFACFETGKILTHQAHGQPVVRLYPLKNAAAQITSVIAIETDIADANLFDAHLDVAVEMLLQIYQNFTALINDNERDTLTGLLNRKTFDLKVNKVLAKMHNSAKRKEDKASALHYLAIFDIDHFKRVNDDYGHLIGDEVLLMFSQLMRQSFRETDPLFRFGGEEFVGLFECSNADDIHIMLERFRQKIALFAFPQVGKVTVSLGYTAISTFDTASQLIDRADTALYYAKNHGRNRTDCYEKLIADGALAENKKEGDIELF